MLMGKGEPKRDKVLLVSNLICGAEDTKKQIHQPSRVWEKVLLSYTKTKVPHQVITECENLYYSASKTILYLLLTVMGMLLRNYMYRMGNEKMIWRRITIGENK